MSPGAGTDVTIFDADGHNVPLSATDTLLSENVANLSGTTTSRVKWSDGVARITDWTNVDPFAWRVAVGVPVIENTVAGHSLVTLAVTWAAALLASTLLVVGCRALYETFAPARRFRFNARRRQIAGTRRG
jgi:hypothetical protein